MNRLLTQSRTPSLGDGSLPGAYSEPEASNATDHGYIDSVGLASTGCMTPSLYGGSPAKDRKPYPSLSEMDAQLQQLREACRLGMDGALERLCEYALHLADWPDQQVNDLGVNKGPSAQHSYIWAGNGDVAFHPEPSFPRGSSRSHDGIMRNEHGPSPQHAVASRAGQSLSPGHGMNTAFAHQLRRDVPEARTLGNAQRGGHASLGSVDSVISHTPRDCFSFGNPLQRHSWSPIPPRSTSMPTHADSAARRRFHPMQAVTQTTPCRYDVRQPQAVSGAEGVAFHFSSQYHGMHTESNASVEHLTPDQNCGLWLTNLPAGVTVHELLSSVRGIGRVWCTYINAADHIKHRTAAAKLVFFTPNAAGRLIDLSWNRGLFVRGYRVQVAHNRIKSKEHPPVGKVSRVLIITGRADFVNEKTLFEYFRNRFIFEVDEIKELIKANQRCVVEFRFGSYRCQAQMGKMALEKDRPEGFEKVEFGDDPCEVGDTLTAYGIAAQRIQGIGM